MNNLHGHFWCNCLECDQSIEAFRILIIGLSNRDKELELALVHFPYTDDSSYMVFGELYLLLNPAGAIMDPQLYDEDEDDDDEDF